MRFGVIVNIEKENVLPVLNSFFSALLDKKIDFLINDEMRPLLQKPERFVFEKVEDMVEKSDCLLSFGGDGTLLRTARAVDKSEKPILGVNIGKLGF